MDRRIVHSGLLLCMLSLVGIFAAADAQGDDGAKPFYYHDETFNVTVNGTTRPLPSSWSYACEVTVQSTIGPEAGEIASALNTTLLLDPLCRPSFEISDVVPRPAGDVRNDHTICIANGIIDPSPAFSEGFCMDWTYGPGSDGQTFYAVGTGLGSERAWGPIWYAAHTDDTVEWVNRGCTSGPPCTKVKAVQSEVWYHRGIPASGCDIERACYYYEQLGLTARFSSAQGSCYGAGVLPAMSQIFCEYHQLS